MRSVNELPGWRSDNGLYAATKRVASHSGTVLPRSSRSSYPRPSIPLQRLVRDFELRNCGGR